KERPGRRELANDALHPHSITNGHVGPGTIVEYEDALGCQRIGIPCRVRLLKIKAVELSRGAEVSHHDPFDFNCLSCQRTACAASLDRVNGGRSFYAGFTHERRRRGERNVEIAGARLVVSYGTRKGVVLRS